MKTCRDCVNYAKCVEIGGANKKKIYFRKVMSLAEYSPTVPNGCICRATTIHSEFVAT